MLNIIFGNCPEAIYNTSVYFNNVFLDNWMKDDFTKASKLCGEVSSDWDKTASFLDTLLIHDYIDSIGINLSQMKTHIDSCCPDMYFAGSAGAKKGLASIKGSEYPKFDNIF